MKYTIKQILPIVALCIGSSLEVVAIEQNRAARVRDARSNQPALTDKERKKIERDIQQLQKQDKVLAEKQARLTEELTVSSRSAKNVRKTEMRRNDIMQLGQKRADLKEQEGALRKKLQVKKPLVQKSARKQVGRAGATMRAPLKKTAQRKPVKTVNKDVASAPAGSRALSHDQNRNGHKKDLMRQYEGQDRTTKAQKLKALIADLRKKEAQAQAQEDTITEQLTQELQSGKSSKISDDHPAMAKMNMAIAQKTEAKAQREAAEELLREYSKK